MTPLEERLAERQVGRSLNAVENGMFAAMWSEHCAYKHSRRLLRALPSQGSRVLVGPGENAGALDLGDGLAVVFKVESHNHPSAVEPYQGAATGVGGILRDVFTMGARPIALLNALRFGPLEAGGDRTGYLFDGVVAGIGGYGNCVGVPDVGGEIVFDRSYAENPLVNAMCVGLAQHDQITLSRAAGPGNALLLVGASTGRDGIQGAAFASEPLTADTDARRPAVQVGDPFMEKLLLEACLELAGTPAVVAMQDLGAAGLTCALSEVASRGGVGVSVDLDQVPRREAGMTPGEVLLSESQERMLVVVVAGHEPPVRSVFERYGLHAATIGSVIDDPMVRAWSAGVLVCDLPAASLAGGAPLYAPEAVSPPAVHPPQDADLIALAREPVSAADLLALLASPNLRSRRSVWLRYDHMNGTNTLVGPGAGDAALLRVPGTGGALALAIDGAGAGAALDPRTAAAAAVVEGAMNVACCGATPLGITDCLNLGSPESATGAWQLREVIGGIADACRALGLPVVSGNVSLYNESAAGPIRPTPVIGTVGWLDERDARVPLGWQAGDEVWLLGDPAWDHHALAGSEFAALRGCDGGSPRLDLASAARLVNLLPRLAARRLLHGAHDLSTGGLGVGLARLAVASGIGARITLPAAGRALPAAALFGERTGRVLVALSRDRAGEMAEIAADQQVAALRLGKVGGERLTIDDLDVGVGDLRVAHATPLLSSLP